LMRPDCAEHIRLIDKISTFAHKTRIKFFISSPGESSP
jgi:hypothetical protein